MKQIKQGICVLVCGILLVIMAACTTFGDFDAGGYVQATLDQMFQGDAAKLASFEEKSEKDLEDAYEEYIRTFSEGLTEGLNASPEMEDQFFELCREIFRTAKYNVAETEKVSKEEYRVSVEIQPADTFVKWESMLAESVQSISEKAERGEYQGTEEEILQLMLFDIAAQSCELLESAYQETEYGEKETVVLTVKKDENGTFQPDEDEISDFVTKILRLDAIQD